MGDEAGSKSGYVRQPCSQCKGMRSLDIEKVCSTCNGSGKNYAYWNGYLYEDCSVCWGRGRWTERKDCLRCWGSGSEP